MRYDFDEITDRHCTNSVKWDLNPDKDVIPMWVADMDFKTAPFVIEAVRKRIDHGVFGYALAPQSYYDSVTGWFWKRRGWKIEREWIQCISGIVPALAVVIQAFTEPGDGVVFCSPAYNCFFDCTEYNGRKIMASRLICDESGEELRFMMDFDDIEARCSAPEAKIFILCNPHNPAGRIWTKEELLRVGEICRRHGVIVVSDEIHCEIEMPGYSYIPFASTSKENQECSITFCSPSKAFNIAGLQIANIVTPDPVKRERILAVMRASEHCDINPVGIDALQAAYSAEGEEWLKQMNAYIHENYLTFKKMMEDALPEFKVSALEGTYLLWLDCKALTKSGISTVEAQESLIKNEKVWINNGGMYGDADFMRINIACPKATLVEGTSRLISGIKRLLHR